MSSSKKINVKELFSYKLKKTQHILRLRMDEALRVLDLTTPQYAVLAQLELKSGISNAALSRSAFITAQTMHGIVSNLERRGLLIRKNDTANARILLTELTKQGHKLVAQAHEVVIKIESQMLAEISEDHKLLFEKMLIECFNKLNG